MGQETTVHHEAHDRHTVPSAPGAHNGVSTPMPIPGSTQAGALPDLTTEELVRYDRHLLLPQVGVEGQRKLKAASVLLIGAGGLGSPLALYLAAPCTSQRPGWAALALWISMWWMKATYNGKSCTARKTLAVRSWNQPPSVCMTSIPISVSTRTRPCSGPIMPWRFVKTTTYY